MEVTGQAFEDMQEQNTRLLGTLREKDDGNLKMMAERMKATQIHKLMKEEKVVLEEQTKMLQVSESKRRRYSFFRNVFSK